MAHFWQRIDASNVSYHAQGVLYWKCVGEGQGRRLETDGGIVLHAGQGVQVGEHKYTVVEIGDVTTTPGEAASTFDLVAMVRVEDARGV